MDSTHGDRLPLADLCPALERSLPRVALCQLPTPIERAWRLERVAGSGPIFIKHDDQTACAAYGGNKPRKLEWTLGRARERGTRNVLTFGGLGSNHAFATAFYAGKLGLGCDLVLVDQPVTDSVCRQLLNDHAAGARIHYGRNTIGAARMAARLLLRNRRTALIPVGGSSPLGTLGFVNAGLELARQIEAGELPEPARVYVACGSGGTSTGLAIGLALAGLRSRVVAVVVTDKFLPSPARLRRLTRRTRALLRRAGAGVKATNAAVSLTFEKAFLGPGYGCGTPEARAAEVQAWAEQGLRVDPVYSAKALAALLARERGEHDPILFWSTYSASHPDLDLPDWRELPSAFHGFFMRPTDNA